MIREEVTDSLLAEPYIEKAIEGDEEAFTWLYKRYYKKVFFFATQFFKSDTQAEDIVQEVFIQVHKKIHTLQSAKAFHSWLHTIMYRTCVDHKRGKIILTQFENESDEELLIEDNSSSVTECLENQRIQSIVIETLDNMKLPLRIVGQLKFLEDMKNVEIAEVLNIPKNTVNKRIRKIKDILQDNLEKNDISISSYSSVLVSPTMLHEAYQVLFNTHTISEATSNHVLHNVLHGTIKRAGRRSVSYLTKYVIGIMIALSIIFILYQTNQNDSYSAIFNSNMEEVHLLEKVQPIVEEVAQIVTINYSAQWQQTPVILDVITSNDNYDKITINDMENLKISDNGTYTVKLIDDNEVINQQVITITNIDRKSPKVTTDKDNNNYYFYITDDLSGVDVSNIKYIKNGVISSDYTYANNTLVMPYDSISTHEIYIYDYAGNVTTTTVN